jgi:hypothetical protein
MRTSVVALLWVAVVAAPIAAQQPARTPVGPAGLGWAVDRADLAGNVKFEPVLGRADAMILRGNTHVVKTGLDFGDGTIEFDLAPLANGDFAAITFRRQSFANHENIYLRLRRSDFMAMQYAPRVNGSSTWQLYQEFAVATDWPRETWTHIRVEVIGSKMEVFVGNNQKPALIVPRLRNGTTNGEIGFWARVNDRQQEWAAALSNLRVTPAKTVTPLSAAANAPVQFIWNWQISEPTAAAGARHTLPAAAGARLTLPAAAGARLTLPAVAKWNSARAEESGLVNVNRLYPVQKERSVIFARHTLRSDAARRVLAGIGYSDDVTVFVNGEPIYVGINGWDSRAPALNSFVDTRWESVFLPLREGDNEIVLAVADDQRFGWGFAMRIDDATGLKF